MMGLYDFNIVERLCKFFCDLVGWQLAGKTVLLRIDEAAYARLFNHAIRGTIYDVKSSILTTGPGGATWLDDSFAIIHVDSSLIIDGRNVEWLIAVPRHRGYGLYRLWCTWIVVYIHVLDQPVPPQEISWNNITAVCSMKLS